MGKLYKTAEPIKMQLAADSCGPKEQCIEYEGADWRHLIHRILRQGAFSSNTRVLGFLQNLASFVFFQAKF